MFKKVSGELHKWKKNHNHLKFGTIDLWLYIIVLVSTNEKNNIPFLFAQCTTLNSVILGRGFYSSLKKTINIHKIKIRKNKTKLSPVNFFKNYLNLNTYNSLEIWPAASNWNCALVFLDENVYTLCMLWMSFSENNFQDIYIIYSILTMYTRGLGNSQNHKTKEFKYEIVNNHFFLKYVLFLEHSQSYN